MYRYVFFLFTELQHLDLELQKIKLQHSQPGECPPLLARTGGSVTHNQPGLRVSSWSSSFVLLHKSKQKPTWFFFKHSRCLFLSNKGPAECSSKLSSSMQTCQAETIHTLETKEATFIAAKRRAALRRKTKQSRVRVWEARRGLVMHLLERRVFRTWNVHFICESRVLAAQLAPAQFDPSVLRRLDVCDDMVT